MRERRAAAISKRREKGRQAREGRGEESGVELAANKARCAPSLRQKVKGHQSIEHRTELEERAREEEA